MFQVTDWHPWAVIPLLLIIVAIIWIWRKRDHS